MTASDAKLAPQSPPDEPARKDEADHRPRPAAAARAATRPARCTDDSVAVGYGSQRRCDMTSAVGSLAVDARTVQAMGTLAEVLRARVPGLDVITGPSGLLSLRVRGATGGFSSSAEPLLVIDGMPIEGAIGGALAAIAGVLAGTPAAACPLCDGGPDGVNEVRREVFGPDFWPNVLAVAAPFAVVAAAAAAVHLIPPRRPTEDADERG